MPTLQQLKEELQSKRRDSQEEELVKIHDILMVEYGWIPFKEFQKLPIPTLLNLLDCIKERHDKEKQEYDKMKSKMPRRK